MERNWAELNPDLLHQISKKLENFSIFIRFRSVCKCWCLIADPTDLPPLLPWILQPTTDLSTKTDYLVYSLSSDTTYQINLPITHAMYTRDKKIIYANGFFLFTGSNTSYLLNPLTKTKFHVPFPTKLPYFTIYMDPNPNRNSSTVKGGVHLVLCGIHKNESEIGFFRSHNEEFTTFRIPLISSVIGYYKSKLFVYSHGKKETRIFDMTTGSEMSIVIPDPVEGLCFEFFVEAMGDMLGVVSPDVCGTKFKVYRLEHTNDFGQCKWIELKGIGDRVLIIDGKFTAFCLSTSACKALRKNCIYYFEPYIMITKDGDTQRLKYLVRYNIEDGTTKKLIYNIASMATWFMPCLI